MAIRDNTVTMLVRCLWIGVFLSTSQLVDSFSLISPTPCQINPVQQSKTSLSMIFGRKQHLRSSGKGDQSSSRERIKRRKANLGRSKKGRRATTLLGTPQSYLEALDTLSGKMFRAASYKGVIEAANNTTETIKQKAVDDIKEGNGIIGKLVSTRMVQDLKRRSRHYKSDWTDGFQKKRQVIPAILFLYFACLSPAVSFGTIASEITNGSMGIVEFLLSSGCSGMVRYNICLPLNII